MKIREPECPDSEDNFNIHYTFWIKYELIVLMGQFASITRYRKHKFHWVQNTFTTTPFWTQGRQKTNFLLSAELSTEQFHSFRLHECFPSFNNIHLSITSNYNGRISALYLTLIFHSVQNIHDCVDMWGIGEMN